MSDDRIGFGPRLGAILVDGIFQSIGGYLIGGVIGGMIGSKAGATEGMKAAVQAGAQTPEQAEAIAALATAGGGFFGAIMGAIIGIAVFALLYGLIEAFTGASPAKMIFGFKIRNDDGSPASTGKLLTRYAAKNASMLLQAIGGLLSIGVLVKVGGLAGLVIFIGCFFALGEAKQALHDKIAGTAVYKKAASG